jgi:AAA+ ATPase superfamily predicted ATPase
LAETLFFGTSPALEFEPARLLRDEGVATSGAQAMLEVVGRGSERPSEIASRLGTAQTNLSRQFQVLLDAGVLERQLPWGESLRSTKRTSYRLADPTLRFWFRVYSPHRTRWASLTTAEKTQLLSQHAASVFEDQVRAAHPGAGRYWEPGVELDVVAEERDGRLLVGEVKWARLSKRDRDRELAGLEARFASSALAAKWKNRRFELFDSSWLTTLAGKPAAK